MLGDMIRRAANRPLPHRLDETITAFLARYDNPETSRMYAMVLLAFGETMGPHRTLASITPEELDTWSQQLRDRCLTSAAMTKRVKIIKTFWNWCIRRDYVVQSPARFLVVKRRPQSLVSKAIPSDVLAAMFERVQQKNVDFVAARDTAILALLITFGARAGDVARLKLDHIRLDEQRILFRVKGDKELLLPLPAQTQQHLSTWLDRRTALAPDPAHDYVFVNIHTRPGHRYAPLATASVSTLVRRLSERTCGQAYGPHSIRHWRGQTLADQRVAPTIVQAILGHSDVRITLEHYYNQDWHRVRHILDLYEVERGLAHAVRAAHRG